MSNTQPASLPAWERPIRIPGRIPIRHADPPFALAGQCATWTLPFELTDDLPEGEVVLLQHFGGRHNKGVFESPEGGRPIGLEHMTARAPDGTTVALETTHLPGVMAMSVPAGGWPAGEIVTVTIGEPEPAPAPTCRILNKLFILYRAYDPIESSRTAKLPSWVVNNRTEDVPLAETVWTRQTDHLIVGACTLHVLGGSVEQLRAYAPANARPGDPIALLVRPEDRYSNLSCRTIDDVSVRLDGAELPSRLEPVPDSTCVRLHVQLPTEGVHRLTVQDRATGHETTTNPILCRTDAPESSVYWGMIHGHTEMSDGTGTLAYYFHQIRDEAGLDFAATGDHDQPWEVSTAFWQTTCDAVARANDPDRFVAFLGYEWAQWNKSGDGDRNVYYRDDHRPIRRCAEGHYPRPSDLFAALRDEQAIVIPHHTGHAGNWCDWKDHDTVHERLVEIYQTRGSFECPPEAGNPVPERGNAEPVAAGYVSRALAMGWRVGFTGGGDDHGGHAGTEVPRPGEYQYEAGLMSVEARARTREAIWDALWNRRVVATTGPRMLLSYRLNNRPMGSELDASTMPELAASRRLRIEYHGTAEVQRIDVIRNNEVVHTVSPSGLDHELTWEDTRPLAEVLLPPAEFCPNPFCFYYVRVVQTDRHAAWASPVWIDAEGDG